ncbi:MAG: SUMF1/EgtB/PvdO family nonheme iron enzyme [Bryobacteraceae bacterium]
MRGGSWNNNTRNVRASNRNRNEPTNRNNNIGFRCVGDGEIGRSRGFQGSRGHTFPLPGGDPDAGLQACVEH